MLGFGHSSRQGAKTPSSERKTLCHFDRREKSFLDPSHLLGMTDLGPLPLRLGVFAGDNPISASAFFALNFLLAPAVPGEKKPADQEGHAADGRDRAEPADSSDAEEIKTAGKNH